MVTYFGRPLNKEERERINKACQIIESDFLWSSTPEGHEYWEAVVDKLSSMANGENRCESCGQVVSE